MKHIIIIFLTFTINIYTQNVNSVIVYYNESYNSVERKNELFTEAVLLHNVNEYVYEVAKKQLEINKENKGITETETIKEIPYQVYFKDFNNNTLIWQIGKDNSISVISDLDLIKWNLKNEKKYISGLLCKKAVAETDKGVVEAWYSDELGINGGPREYDGLPGLILYLKNDYFIFKATKIQKKIKKSIIPQRDRNTKITKLEDLKKGVSTIKTSKVDTKH
jgi:GLPGLI family protein